ncbi:MAG: MBL fold metallo-hydrolase [Bdellovibrionota bacterium]
MIKTLADILDARDAHSFPGAPWQLRAVIQEECLGYFVWNEATKEALVIDPRLDAEKEFLALAAELPATLILAVIDTHTHADHISGAPRLAERLGIPLIMHEEAPCKRVHVRIARETSLQTKAGALHLIPTAGHTPDGLCVLWGKFLFTGDTILFGDTGRDDLPGGDPEAHFASVTALKRLAQAETLVLPGHDSKGGRVSSWKTQLEISPSLTQEREQFVREAAAFVAPAPKLLKESLVENMR